MTSLYGQRWVDSYGSEPDELWQHALAAATEAELKRAIKALMTRGGAHPPALPEFLELAKPGTAAKSRDRHPEPYSPEWNDARKGVFAKIAAQSVSRGVQFPEHVREASAAAMSLIDNPPGAIGHDDARRENERLAARRMAPLVGMTPEQLIAKWHREAAAQRTPGRAA
jgi:hypothetical protein